MTHHRRNKMKRRIRTVVVGAIVAATTMGCATQQERAARASEQAKKVAEALKKRGFKAVCCATGAEARAYVMKESEGAKSVGFGGSVTVNFSIHRSDWQNLGFSAGPDDIVIDE
jgi:predicted Rossmann-fold nucleotide-binding protein